MAKRLLKLNLGPQQEEYDIHGTSDFPCEIYETNLQLYQNNIMPEHWHNELEIGYISSGTVQFTVNDHIYDLHENEVYFTNTHRRHSMKGISTNARFFSIVFHLKMVEGPDSINRYLNMICQGSNIDFLCIKSEDILTRIRRIIEQREKSEICHEIIIRNDLSSILALIFKRYVLNGESIQYEKESLRIEKMLTFISHFYMRNIQVKEIARAANISVRECYRSFRAELNSTPTAYLYQYRMRIAGDLLEKTDLKIDEIAEKCGFAQTTYFSRKFKEKYDMTPSAYRKAKETTGDKV